MTQNFYFDIQRFATGTAVKIGGVVNNVEVGDTFTVEGAKYTVLAVEKNSVTALVDVTPAENLGKQIVIGDGKSIDGVTYQTTALEDADSEISTKYTYKLDIGGNPVFVTVFDNAIESVADSDGNALSASGDDYTVNGKNFSLSLVDGIPQADYTVTNSVATTLDKVTYSFSVDSKPVEVVVQNDAISSVTVDSEQVGTAAGTYFVGEKSLKVSYADGNFSAETAAPVSTSIISSVATYQVGDTKVTVTDGNLSQTTAKVNGHNAKLTYSADTKKITATYSVTTTSTTTTTDPNTYNVTLPDNSTVKVKINGESIESVTKSDGTAIPKEGDYYTVTNGNNTYNLEFDYANNKLTAEAEVIVSSDSDETVYTVAVDNETTPTEVTLKRSGNAVTLSDASGTEISINAAGVYPVKVGNTSVRLKYDTTKNILYDAGVVVDLSTLTDDYEAQDGDILTGELSEHSLSIAKGATVTLRGVTIDQTNNGKAGIECAGDATIVLEGDTNSVTGADHYAGIQAGDTGTTLTIKGTGSLTATGGTDSSVTPNEGGAGIGSSRNGVTCGNIVIESGTIIAAGGNWAAGIGSGSYNSTSDSAADCGAITISGGNITANGGDYAAGIGSGTHSTCGDITISDGTIKAKGGYAGAGIGSGTGGTSSCGNIKISGGTVTAKGGATAAGIGAGWDNKTTASTDGNVPLSCGNITISGGKVTATSSSQGAGIGAGVGAGGTSSCGDIKISGGTVTATSGSDGAGIGAGLANNGISKCGDITIENTVTSVTATKGSGATNSIGAGKNNETDYGTGESTCGTVTINGTTYESGYTGDTITGDNVVDLSTLTDSDVAGGVYTVATGKILTGTTSTYKISIAAGATVTLSGVTITGNNAAGITCAGTATIILEGTNEVKGASDHAGIQAGGTDTTLTIKGSGSLTATAGNASDLDDKKNIKGSAGIGSSYQGTCGDIEISGGNITANGSSWRGPGIGSGSDSTCGNITISGGTVTAKGGEYAAGIGSNGDDNNVPSKCGNITISGGTVTATGGNDGAGIGAGMGNSTCGNITISSGTVTATGTRYAAGIGSGRGDEANSKCGNITISGGTVTASGGVNGGAGIGSGLAKSTCGDIEISKGTVTATGGKQGAGIGTDTGTCGNITIENGVTSVTATKGETAINSIGQGGSNSIVGTVTIGGTTYKVGNDDDAITDETYTYPSTDISFTQNFTVNDTKITFTTTTQDATPSTTTTYKIGDDEEEKTIPDTNKITVDSTEVTVTTESNKVKELSYNETDIDTENDQRTVTISSTRTVTPTFDATQTLYTFAVDGENVSVAVDSSGNMTYDGQAVTDNKITVDGVEVTLNVSGKEITGASYLGKYSPVTDIEQVDAYKATIDGQSVSLIFDANNQCNVEVNGKNYLLTKTANGATFTEEVEKTGVEDSRIYLLEVGGERYWIGCTFDAKGNLTAVTSDDKNLSIDGTTIKIGDYTVEVGGTKDALKTSATLTVYGEGVKDVEVNQLFVLSGVKTTDGITLEDGVVLLTAANLNGQDVTIEGDGYTLALDKNYSPTETTGEHFEGNVYKSESYSDGYEISDDAKSISYIEEIPATDLFTLSGIKSTDGITVENGIVTLTAANLNGEDIEISVDGYTLALDKDYSPTTTGEHFEGNTYKSASMTDGYEISDDAKSISYVSEIPATDLFTLSGVKTTDGITVKNNVVTLTAGNLNNQDATISGDGYTLQLAEGIAEPTFDEGGWTLSGTTATYKSENNTDGYTLSDDKKIVTYTAANDPEISLKVYGVKSLDGLSLDGTTVTVAASSLDKQTVTISDGYTLALAEGIKAPTFDEGGWTLSGTTATYTNASNTDGYEISDDAKSISYVAEVPATDLFVLSGVKTTDGITVKNNIVTLTAANLNNQDAKIEGDGYTLALAEGIKAPTFDEGGWTLSGTTATYTNASNTDGYEISDDAKSISYVAEVPATDLFVLSGVKTTDGITVKNNIVTLTAANLNGQDVKISGDGYTLQLADGIKAPTFDEGGWTLSGTTATYTSESNTAGYTLAGDAKVVTYTPAHDADISLKVYGVKSLDGLSLDGTTVTVAASSLDKQTVTISKGYTLAIADDVEQPSTRGKYWTQLDEDTYLYTSSSTTAGYTLSNNKITYSDESVSGEQYTIKGAADTELISETDDTEDVAEDSLSRRKVVLIETDEHNPENNLDFYTENYAQVKIASGQDSLITYDGARSKVDMADADNVTVVSFDGQVQLDNYDVESGAVVLVQDINDIIDAIKTNKIKLVGNEIWINFSSRVAINNPNNDSTVVELVNYDGEKQLVGFTGKNGGTLDMSEFNENAVLKGNYSENSPETKYIGSTLKGGKNNDTLLAGSRDYVDGGEGQNEIYLTPYEMRYKKDGATVVSGGNSRNTVYNFHEGFGYDGDYVQVENLSDVEFKFENDGLSIASENARLKLKGIGVNSSSADAVSDFGTENPELILLTDGQTTLQSAIAKTDESILVTEKDGLKPNAFFGKRSGLNFSEYGGTVEVNLADGTGALSGRDAIFSGINKIQAGDGISRLIGSDETNTLIAGNGYGSLAGGAGDDELFGRSGSADKAGRTEFLYFEGDGRDVIYDFEFLTAENKAAGTADKIGVDTLVTKISCSGNDVVLQVNNSDENLTIKNAAGKTFQINDLILKVDKNIVYDGLANCYIADGGDLVSVDSSVDSAEIWLDNSHGTAFVGEIKTLDASAVDGKTSLAGNAFDNTIIAGNGDSSLWGGDFGNDLLIGGGGKNTFFYNFGNGNDTIQNAKAGDVVDLTNITLEQISAENITDSGVELEFIDGGTLTVNGTDCEYRVAGTSYVVDNGKWKIK